MNTQQKSEVLLTPAYLNINFVTKKPNASLAEIGILNR